MLRWFSPLVVSLTLVSFVSHADPNLYGASATVTAIVPIGATLTIDGVRTSQMTAVRQFVSPPLPYGKRFAYKFVIQYTQNGHLAGNTADVEVWANAAINVNMLEAKPIAPPKPKSNGPEDIWIKPDRPEPEKGDSPREEAPKVDPPKADPVKPTPPKQDPPKVDPPKADPVKPTPPKQDPPKVDPPKADPVKPTPPKQDPPKVDPVKPIVSEVDPLKVEPPKPALPKVDIPVAPPKSAPQAEKPPLPSEKLNTEIEVPFVPTPQLVVDSMLKMANVKPGDVVLDLGCGDGRIPITAVQKFQAKKGLGIDFNPVRIRDSRANAEKAGKDVEARVDFRIGDVLKLEPKDFEGVTVVTLYLLPEVNQKLRPILLKSLKPGSRVVSHDFDMGDDWMPDEARMIMDDGGIGHVVYLWKVK